MTDASNEQPEPFNLNSDDVAARKRADLKRLLPEVFSEDKIDLDQLRRVMGDWVGEGTERFGLTWPGKAACMKVIQAPATGALRPDRDESVNFDESKNVFIEGDNLEVLKLLQKAYFGKIKMIYIDPPYNTGHEFIYPDDYSEDLETYLSYTGQVDDIGRRFSTNTDSSGRFHSRWLNMMYPRIFLAKNLLRQDGVFFMSIGQAELTSSVMILDQIFGEVNRISICTRLMKSGGQKGRFFSPNTDYVLVYANNIDSLEVFRGDISQELQDKVYNQIQQTGDRAGERYRSMGLFQPTLDKRPNQRYFIECPDGTLALPPGSTAPEVRSHLEKVKPVSGDGVWRWTPPKFEEEAKKGNVLFVRSEKSPLLDQDGNPSSWNIYTKIWLKDRLEDGSLPLDMFDKFENRHSSKELSALGIPFEYAKPTELIAYLMQIIGINNHDIVLDFFAGSCSTAHAALKLNQASNDNRVRYICVQLPEPVEEGDVASNAGFSTISQIGRERIRRAGRVVCDASVNCAIDAGFRAFSLGRSAFRKWNVRSDETANDLLFEISEHANHSHGATDEEALLFELLLADGFDLTTKIERASVAGAIVHCIADGALLICLERNLTKEIIDALADLAEKNDAARVVCLDAGFRGNDQLKANAVQTFKSRLGHGVDGRMFRTV